MDLLRTSGYLFQGTIADICLEGEKNDIFFFKMSANAADSRAGRFSNTSLGTVLTPTGTGMLP